MNNQYAQQQKILLYVFPLVFAVSGVNFPIGVLLYWLTTNVWSMGQQFYVIRRNPTPGSPAAEALARRRAAKEQAKAAADPSIPEAPEPENGSTDGGQDRPGQRKQPRKGERKGGTRPSGSTPGSTPDGKPGATDEGDSDSTAASG